MNKKVNFVKTQQQLAVLWFTGAGLVFAILVLQSLLGRYGDQVQSAWQWFLPTVLPTLSFMVAVFVLEFQKSTDQRRSVDIFYFRLAFWVSLVYLFIVLLTLVLASLQDAAKTMSTLSQSHLWFGPFQGITSGVLGMFFVKKGESS